MAIAGQDNSFGSSVEFAARKRFYDAMDAHEKRVNMSPSHSSAAEASRTLRDLQDALAAYHKLTPELLKRGVSLPDGPAYSGGQTKHAAAVGAPERGCIAIEDSPEPLMLPRSPTISTWKPSVPNEVSAMSG